MSTFGSFTLISSNFFQAITFHGSGSHDGRHEYKTKVIDHVITSEETAGCDVLQNKNFNVDLRVPSIPPTDFSTSSVVHVKYLIRVSEFHAVTFAIRTTLEILYNSFFSQIPTDNWID